MGAIRTTRTITVTRLTGDGKAGYWWCSVDSNARLSKLNYAGPNDVTERIGTLYDFDTFKDFLQRIVTNNVSLPIVELGININSIATEKGIQSQISESEISNSDLILIDGKYGAENFCKVFGVLVFIRRYFLGNIIDLSTLGDIYIYLGQNRKATSSQVEAEIDILIAEGKITKAQKAAFVTRWQNEVV